LTNIKLALLAVNPEAALRSTTHAKIPTPNEKGMLPSAKAPLGLRHKDLIQLGFGLSYGAERLCYVQLEDGNKKECLLLEEA
jgi:hypothetical protein